MIVFPHIHKTAGTSIGTDLKGRVYRDYGRDHPMSFDKEVERLRELYKQSFFISSKAHDFITQYDMVYGHFRADAYMGLNLYTQVDFLCFLRDPVERTISHYYFWKNKVLNGTQTELKFQVHPELHLFKNRDFTITDFASLNSMKHYYSLMLGNCRISDFAFIGITEYFNKSIDTINNMFGTELTNRFENITEKSIYNIKEIKTQYDDLKKINEENEHYYNEALVRFWNK